MGTYLASVRTNRISICNMLKLSTNVAYQINVQVLKLYTFIKNMRTEYIALHSQII